MVTRRRRGRRAAADRDQGAGQPRPEGADQPRPEGADQPRPGPAPPGSAPRSRPEDHGGPGPARGPEEPPGPTAGAGRPGPAIGEGADLVQRLEEEISQPSGLLRACLLLLLSEQAGHGYDLHERLKGFGFDRIDASRSYRALHWLEKAELAEAHWETDNRGPARRVYELTPAGHLALERCVVTLQERSRMLGHYVARYRRAPKRS